MLPRGGVRMGSSPPNRAAPHPSSRPPPASSQDAGPLCFLTINGTAPSIVSAGAAAGCHSSEYFPLAVSPLHANGIEGGERGEPPSPGCVPCPPPRTVTLPPDPSLLCVPFLPQHRRG